MDVMAVLLWETLREPVFAAMAAGSVIVVMIIILTYFNFTINGDDKP